MAPFGLANNVRQLDLDGQPQVRGGMRRGQRRQLFVLDGDGDDDENNDNSIKDEDNSKQTSGKRRRSVAGVPKRRRQSGVHPGFEKRGQQDRKDGARVQRYQCKRRDCKGSFYVQLMTKETLVVSHRPCPRPHLHSFFFFFRLRFINEEEGCPLVVRSLVHRLRIALPHPNVFLGFLELARMLW